MTLQIRAAANLTHNSPLLIPYTGTKVQPDTVSLFFKNARNQIFIKDENVQNSFNYNPLYFIYSIRRITEAVKKIFRCMIRKDDDLWNATKNLTRGVVALIPLLGNATLYVYDCIKTKFYTHSQVKKALAEQNGDLLGIVFDGKVITTFSLNDFSKALKNPPTRPLSTLNYLWVSLLQKSLKEFPTQTRKDLAVKISNMIVV